MTPAAMTAEEAANLTLKPPVPLRLAQTPTPIHHLPRLSAMLGTRIYCLRDDLTGFGFGGNKIRKLEYLLSDALQRGCDTIVTCGSNQSNWCRMAAVAGSVLGMEAHLVLGGPEPAADTGNLRLARIAGATISHIDTMDDDVLERASREIENTLRARDKQPCRMIMGGSTGLGALGYAHALFEAMSFERANGLRFSRIVHATGSGGTQAGVIAGALLRDWAGEIIGKAAAGLLEYGRSGRFGRAENVLFIHTGGAAQLFE